MGWYIQNAKRKKENRKIRHEQSENTNKHIETVKKKKEPKINSGPVE